MEGILSNPAFFFTYAVIQAGVLVVLARYLDFYDRQALSVVALVAVWGATGAAALSLAGNEAVRNLLSGDVREVFGNAIAPPIVEEAAKGLALLAAVGPVRRLARRAGVPLFEGAGAGVVYGAAVGLGFAFTEDVYFLLDEAGRGGLEAGFEVYLFRRDFFGPAILHHAVFTGALGAGLGLAAWTSRGVLKVAFPLLGYLVAVLLHAVNNGLVQLVLVLRFGVAEAAAWAQGASPAADAVASSIIRLMRVVDFYYLVMFFGVLVLWARYERKVIRAELDEEVEGRLVTRAEVTELFEGGFGRQWRLLLSGQLERWRHVRRLRHELARLALLKWRTRRFGGEWARVGRLRRQVATLATYDVVPVKIPVPPTPLVGRRREIQEIRSLLADPSVRLVTLTGAGGSGKTRLAFEVAALEVDRYASGVFAVELASVTDPALVPETIAGVLGIREVTGQSMADALLDFLRDKQLLLVLDNFEQVAASATLVGDLLREARRITILATSRQQLRLAGERDYAVPPLETPDLGVPPTVEDLAGNDAVALFVDRASSARPDFALTAANAGAVAAVCVRLDGLPLAIELAAARITLLEPNAMLDRLSSRLGSLTGGARDLPERHQTLRATIDWSYELLEQGERLLFARMGVFVDGATLQAAEGVLDGLPGLAPGGVVDGLSSLLSKSLMRRVTGPDGDARFVMLETIREYALERLAATGEHDEVSSRHAVWFARLAESAEPELVRADQSTWVRRLEAEVGNLRAVMSRSVAAGNAEPALRVAGALPRFWSMRGFTNEARHALALAREAAGDTVPAAVGAKAAFAHAYLALDAGDYGLAADGFRESLDAYERLGDHRGVASCLAQLGWLAVSAGNVSEAEQMCERSAGLARETDDAAIESVALAGLAEAASRRGDLDRAADLHAQSLTLRRRLGDRRNEANALLNGGRVELYRGHLDDARRLLTEGHAIAVEVGDEWSVSVGLGSLGRVDVMAGDAAKARERLLQALELSTRRGGRRMAAECLESLATLAIDEGRAADGARLLGAAERLRAQVGAGLLPVEAEWTAETRRRAVAALGESATAEKLEDGRALGTDAVLVLAGAGRTGRPVASQTTDA